MCRRELKRAETESTRNSAIIADYKLVSNTHKNCGFAEVSIKYIF